MIANKEINCSAAWFDLECDLRQKIATGESEDSVLELLCAGLERLMHNGERFAVHVVDAEAMRITHVISPSLAEFFHWRGPVWVGPAEGTSAAVAYLRCEITTDHLDESLAVVDPELQAAIRKFGIGSMHARPVLSATGEVLAVFSTYFREPLAQPDQHARLVEAAMQIARTALGQKPMVPTAQRAEKNYFALVEGLHDALIVTREDIIVYANPAMVQMTGRPESELLNSPFQGFIAEQDALMLADRKARRSRGERLSQECKLRVIRADGAARVMRYVESVITWNNAPAILATLADITDQERFAAELQRLNAELDSRVAEGTCELAAARRDLEACSYAVSPVVRAPARIEAAPQI